MKVENIREKLKELNEKLDVLDAIQSKIEKLEYLHEISFISIQGVYTDTEILIRDPEIVLEKVKQIVLDDLKKQEQKLIKEIEEIN